MKCTLLLFNSMATNWSILSKAWAKDFLTNEVSSAGKIAPVLERTLPLLQDPNAVPFVCRYRTDIIEPLSTKQIHKLSDYIQKYNSLDSLREKIIPFLQKNNKTTKKQQQQQKSNDLLLYRVQTSISKSELEDIYAPYKPPSKGSLEDRIRKEHPNLIVAVDELWENGSTSIKLTPRDEVITLLANRIANHLPVMDSTIEYCTRHSRLHVKKQVTTTKSSSSTTTSSSKKKKNDDDERNNKNIDKFKTYFDFNCKLNYLKDHQVLAIRRGIDQKILKLEFDIDTNRIESMIGGILRKHKQHHHGLLYRDAIHDAWTRLIRKRITTRLWKQCTNVAEERAINVFCDNLQKALLEPPATPTPKAILVLDPGFIAGIKCAILNSSGDVIDQSIQTIKFLGTAREKGKIQLMELLQSTKSIMTKTTTTTTTTTDQKDDDDDNDGIVVVIGNGHGMREAQQLINEVSIDNNIPISIQIVNEAGASVWSVTEMANNEFPKYNASSIATISIGRRYLNPLHELIKIPSKSLGLGMYQHDLSQKELNEQLIKTSIFCVTEVGININTCSKEILLNIPSITSKICTNIINSRPIQSREQLLSIQGIGPKTYETCSAFVRINNGLEPLDNTLVHPESYDLARYLLLKLNLKLNDNNNTNPKSSIDNNSSNVLPKSKLLIQKEYNDIIKKASKRFHCTEDRVITVIEHLIFSITMPDPRLRRRSSSSSINDGDNNNNNTNNNNIRIGSIDGCSILPFHISTINELKKVCPVRQIKATIRNVVDFGAFVDFGSDNDGLLHRSKLGSTITLDSLLVGQEIGIDILGVSKYNKVSVGLTGLNLPAINIDDLDNNNNNNHSIKNDNNNNNTKKMEKRKGRRSGPTTTTTTSTGNKKESSSSSSSRKRPNDTFKRRHHTTVMKKKRRLKK